MMKDKVFQTNLATSVVTSTIYFDKVKVWKWTAGDDEILYQIDQELHRYLCVHCICMWHSSTRATKGPRMMQM